MLTCIACQKQFGDRSQQHHEEESASSYDTPRIHQDIKIKDMTLKVSRPNRHYKAAAAGGRLYESLGSERYDRSYTYRGIGLGSEFGDGNCGSTPRLRGPSSAEGTLSVSRQLEAALSGFTEEDKESREWIAQVEPGVLLSLISLSDGGNHLKRIRFSLEMFNKWQAQRWWAENHEKVMELYSLTRFNRQAIPLPIAPHLEDESLKIESAQFSPMVHQLQKQKVPFHFPKPMSSVNTCGMVCPSESVDYLPAKCHYHHQHLRLTGQRCYDSGGLASTPKVSSINGAKMEVSSMASSGRGSSFQGPDCSGEFAPSPSFASDQERELVEEDEPGVYITICVLPGGYRELRRIRFSRERFSEKHARLWWEDNRSRIHHQIQTWTSRTSPKSLKCS
ncbi:hypothetical protein HPP92_005770 [Vanilla planifolia]|uniref:BRX domain-containing protein n=1 Tax=Vanilla planifolia TaxID=51239 RepID=A0A835RUN2_VANPL|nr:hypothetical protein HPP92_005770 [Vanilla planifolia]